MPADAQRSALIFPDNLLAAASHPDPYPYYAALLAYRPIYRETRLGLWVALGAQAVAAVLESPHCRVRPTAEKVPASIAGSRAGEVFGHLVRMNDGARHETLKPALAACLEAFAPERVTAAARSCAAACSGTMGVGGNGLDGFQRAYPVQVVGRLIGLPDGPAAEAAALTGDFVRCLSPLSNAAEIERSKLAAARLLDLIARHGSPMLVERLASLGVPQRETALANLLGLMSQTYEATAGLIGNTLLALARDEDMRRRAAGDDALLRRVVPEVARHDPPIHNTRRYVAEDCLLAGQALQAGDAILVVLAAANRDPAVNPRPHAFDPARADAACFTFGRGAHACPGRDMAVTLAVIGLQALLAGPLDFDSLAAPRYARSVNARIPVFGAQP